MPSYKVSSVVFLVLLGFGISVAARTLLTVEESIPYIHGGLAGGGGGGGSGGGGGGGYGPGGEHGEGYGGGAGKSGGAGYGGGVAGGGGGGGRTGGGGGGGGRAHGGGEGGGSGEGGGHDFLVKVRRRFPRRQLHSSISETESREQAEGPERAESKAEVFSFTLKYVFKHDNWFSVQMSAMSQLVMAVDVAVDDRPPPYQGTHRLWGLLRQPRLHTRQETRNPGLKAITDKSGPVPIRFEVNDRETLMPLGDHALIALLTWGASLAEFPCDYPSWSAKCARAKAGVANIGPSLTCVPTWNPTAGHKSMRASSSTCKRSTMARRLLFFQPRLQ
ncbi:hypothetical protein Tco_0865093 [Tanacetum coccineum]